MSFERPSLSDLVTRIEQDLVSRLELTGAVLRRSVVRIFSRVIAGATHMLHGHLEYLGKQLFPDQSAEAYLLRQGSLFGVERNAPEFATGNVTVTGTNGTDIPAGSVLLRSDGTEYTTDAIATIASGTATIAATASVAAEDGNCDEDTELSFESPISGVSSTATVATGGLTEGADEEAIEDYRERVIERMRSPPHGGSEADYIMWAKEVSGVTRAWVYPGELGAGTVVVRFTRDNDVSPIPSGGEVTDVQDYIDERRPVTAAVTVSAPVAAPLNFTIEVTPDTAEVRGAVEAELSDLLSREAEPGEALLLSSIRTAIGIAAGVEDYDLTSPAADVTHTTGQLATLGTVTWL